jgi:hypothetical protein
VSTPRFSTEHEADMMFRQVDLEPLEPYKNHHQKRLCRCLICGDVQRKTLYMIKTHPYGCVYCSGKRVRPSDAEAVLLEKHGRALEPFRGSSHPWRVACTRCDREYLIRYKEIRLEHRKGFCKPCAGLQLSPEFIEKVLEKAMMRPLEEYPGAGRAWKCLCLVCNSEVAPTFSNLRTGHGCIFCERKKLGESQRKQP